MSKKKEQVILYSTSLHTWEVWQQGRSLAHGSLDSCMAAFPNALPLAHSQIRTRGGRQGQE